MNTITLLVYKKQTILFLGRTALTLILRGYQDGVRLLLAANNGQGGDL
ncbi:hypothetical protein ACH19I_04325 [Yersinia kristensenii]